MTQVSLSCHCMTKRLRQREMRGRCTRRQWRSDKDGPWRGRLGLGEQRWRCCCVKRQHDWRAGIAMICLVQQLTLGRSMSGKQGMNPGQISATGVCTGRTVSCIGCNCYRLNRVSMSHKGRAGRSTSCMHRSVHLTQRRPQQQAQSQQPHEPAHIPALYPHCTQAGAPVRRC